MKQEWEECSLRLKMVLFILFLVSDLCLAITVLAIFAQNSLICALQYYQMWIIIYAMMIICQAALLIIFVIWLLLSIFVICVRAWLAERAIYIVIISSMLLNFIWHIVGSVFFFIDVIPNCSSDMTIYQVGLVLLILKSVLFTISICQIFSCHIRYSYSYYYFGSSSISW